MNTEWFDNFYKAKEFELLKQRPIAYFCAEFAFYDKLPIFAGGLGVLAGDFVMEASGKQIPLLAVGIYYSEGYVWKRVDVAGQIIESVNPISTEELSPVADSAGERIIVQVPIEDRLVNVAAWKLKIGNVNVYLLDANVETNSVEDRQITKRLYSSDKKTRLQQEIILGIGGQKLIEKLEVNPIIYHMNEGHPALVALELACNEMKKRNVDFRTALSIVKKRIVFTNHTLVIAGNDLFDNNLVKTLLNDYVTQNLKIHTEEIISLGQEADTNMFSMTMFLFAASGKVNGVSKLHVKRAAKIWPEHPMQDITNGIHINRWDKISQSQNIWQTHQLNKWHLLSIIKEQTGQEWKEDELLLGWSRRMVKYKRPLAIIEDANRLIEISQKAGRTVHLVIAGEAHPSDTDGLNFLKILRGKINNELKGIAVYLSNYDLNLAGVLTAGCDVWVNTPEVGYEACGTSGMKAALNGVLPLTTRDGWVNETDLYGIGWNLDNDNVTGSFLDILEEEIIPLYYKKDNNGASEGWEENMKRARGLILENFSATRMLIEYIEKLYLPVIQANL